MIALWIVAVTALSPLGAKLADADASFPDDALGPTSILVQRPGGAATDAADLTEVRERLPVMFAFKIGFLVASGSCSTRSSCGRSWSNCSALGRAGQSLNRGRVRAATA